MLSVCHYDDFRWARLRGMNLHFDYNPIVVNTQEKLRQAFEELDRGTFLKQ
jgi:hypothetical protein